MDLKNSKIRKNIANNLKTFREEYGLTQKNVSDALGVDAASYRNWENERSIPGIATLYEISKMYKTSIYQLCGIEFDDDNLPKVAHPNEFNKNVYGESKITELDAYEKQLIMQIRRLTKEDRSKVGECINELLKNNE